MKTSELSGVALDWAVGEASGTPIYRSGKTLSRMDVDGGIYWQPSIDWAQGGPIIEREGIATGKSWEHWKAFTDASKGEGPTPLIAAMRCYVASKLGDDVDVPEELQ
jgi:hypothetical protein